MYTLYVKKCKYEINPKNLHNVYKADTSAMNITSNRRVYTISMIIYCEL